MRRKAIPKKTRLALYEKYNHRCGYCGCEIAYKDMQVDHLKPVYVHGEYLGDMDSEQLNDISNFIPACRQCNLYKSTFELEEFREQLKTTMMENLRKDFRYRLAVKYGLIEEKEHQIVFCFEEMEQNVKEIEDCHYCEYACCSDKESSVDCYVEDFAYFDHHVTDPKEAETCGWFSFCDIFPKY